MHGNHNHDSRISPAQVTLMVLPLVLATVFIDSDVQFFSVYA